MKTRDRIIATAIERFNAEGYGAVTTAALAEACGIAEGNLWYHFKTKRELLTAIGEQFLTRIEARLALEPDAADPVGSYCRMLSAMMQEFRDFRFLYRDQPSYGEHVGPIAANVAGWLGRTIDRFAQHLAAMRAIGLLDWPEGAIRALATNATILLRYGLEHQAELGRPNGAVRSSLLQHLTLFEHALEQGAACEIRDAIERIGARTAKAA